MSNDNNLKVQGMPHDLAVVVWGEEQEIEIVVRPVSDSHKKMLEKEKKPGIHLFKTEILA